MNMNMNIKINKENICLYSFKKIKNVKTVIKIRYIYKRYSICKAKCSDCVLGKPNNFIKLQI